MIVADEVALRKALQRIVDFPALLDEHKPSAEDLVLHHWETVCELKRIAAEALETGKPLAIESGNKETS
jgi:uncharacterized protein YmfQ (DUF2313 family)